MVGSVRRVKLFTTGSRNSHKDVRKSRMMPDQVTLMRLSQKQLCCIGWESWSWYEDNDRQCSNCTRVFPWFSIQHNALTFEISESVSTVGVQRTEEVCPCNISYDMQIKEKICLAGLLPGTNHGCYQPESKRASMQWWQTFRWWRRGWNGGAEVAETTVKRLIC
jgi:hypothetical protein